MDINQQLEYLNLSSDVLTEKDVIDIVNQDTKKIVSSKGIYDSFQNLSTNISSEYAKKQIVYDNFYLLSSIISSCQKSGNYISSSVLNSLASKQYIDDKGFLTSHQSLSDYYKKSETSSAIELKNKFNSVNSNINNRLNIDIFNKEISNYARTTDIEHAGFLTSHQSLSDYYKKSETSSNWQLIEEFNKYNNKDNSYSKNQIDSLLKKYTKNSTVYSKTEINNILNDYVLTNNTSSAIELSDAFDRKQDVGNYLISDDLSDYTSKQYIDDKGFLTSHQSLSDYYKKSETSSNWQIYNSLNLKQDIGNYIEVEDLSNYCYLTNNTSSAIELSDAFDRKQDKGNYVDADFLIDNYYDISETSSASQLRNKFDNYYLSNQTSSRIELKNAFDRKQDVGNYLISDDLSDYCLKTDTSNVVQLSNEFNLKQDFLGLSGNYKIGYTEIYSFNINKNLWPDKLSDFNYIKFNSRGIIVDGGVLNVYGIGIDKYSNLKQIRIGQCQQAECDILVDSECYNFGQYYDNDNTLSGTNYQNIIATRLWTSNKMQQHIDNILSTIYKKSETSSLNEIANEFSKYARLNIDISSNEQLSNAFDRKQDKGNYVDADFLIDNYYDISETSSASQLRNKFDNYYLSNQTSSRIELKNAFDNLEKNVNNKVNLSGDSFISGSLSVSTFLYSPILKTKKLSIDFNKSINTNPQPILSNISEYINDNPFVYELCEKVNDLILENNLNFELLPNRPTSNIKLDKIIVTLNKISKLNGIEQLDLDEDIGIVTNIYNQNVNALSTIISSLNIQQSLSALGNSIFNVNKKINNCKDSVLDIDNKINNFYSKNQTSSSIELKNAFDKKQDVGNYLSTSVLPLLASKKWITDNFVSLTQSNTISTDCIFTENVIINNAEISNTIYSDFANIYNKKQYTVLSSYLVFIQDASTIAATNRINEIITYAKLQIQKLVVTDILNDDLTQIIDRTNKICDYANEEHLQDNPSIQNIVDKLNTLIYKINIPDGQYISLQTVLQQYNRGSMFHEYFIDENKNYINNLSSKINDITNKLEIMTYNLDKMQHILSSFNPAYAEQLSSMSQVISTLIISFT